MVIDNFTVVLTMAIELLNRETLLYTKKAAVKAATKATGDPHLVNYYDNP